MYSRDSFELLLDFGNTGEAVLLNWRRLTDMGVDIEAMAALGLLRKADIGARIECAGCDGFIPVLPRTVAGEVVLYADCPDCGVYALAELEQKAWRIDFAPLLDAVRRDLVCSGPLEELMPGVLWNLGRAALAGQSREVLVCRAINSFCSTEIISRLPEGKTPLLLVIGDAPRPGRLGSFNPDHAFRISELTGIRNGQISVNAAAVAAQLEIAHRCTPAAPAPIGKNAKAGDLAIKLKAELRNFMCGVYSAMARAERFNGEFRFTGILQKELAAAVGAAPVAVNRALKKDMELKALFDAANNPRTAYAYGKKAMK